MTTNDAGIVAASISAHPENFPTEFPDERFDHIVIGAGSAGCVLTRRLLDAGKKVCLVEAGEDETNPNIDHLNNLGLIWHSAQDWNYRSEEHTSELQSRGHLVCRLLLEKKKTKYSE